MHISEQAKRRPINDLRIRIYRIKTKKHRTQMPSVFDITTISYVDPSSEFTTEDLRRTGKH